MSAGVGRFRRLWKYTARALIGVLALVLLLVVWRVYLALLVAGEISSIRDRCHPVTLAELNRWYPRVPTNENSAVVFTKAFASLAREPNGGVALNQLAVNGASPCADSPEQAAAWELAANDQALCLLHEASEMRMSRYPINLGRLSIVPYPHLRDAIRSARLLKAETVSYLAQSNPDRAANSVLALFSLARSLAKEPLVRSHLARLDCEDIAVDALQVLMSRSDLTGAQLKKLREALNEADDERGLARAFIGQRCLGIYGFEMMDGALDMMRMPISREYPSSSRLVVRLGAMLSSPGYLYGLSGLLRWDELAYLKLMSRYVQAAQLGFPGRIDEALELGRLLNQENQLHAFSRVWIRGMSGTKVILKDAKLTARIHTAQMALAIESYRMAEGQLPQTLADMNRGGTTAGKTDPFSGQPLLYKPLVNGYLVYSAGVDEAGRSDNDKEVAFLVER